MPSRAKTTAVYSTWFKRASVGCQGGDGWRGLAELNDLSTRMDPVSADTPVSPLGHTVAFVRFLGAAMRSMALVSRCNVLHDGKPLYFSSLSR